MRRILVWLLLFAIAAAVPVLPGRQPAVMAAPEETAIQTPATAALHIVPLEVTPLPERPPNSWM